MEIEYNYYLNSKPNKRDHKFPYNKIYIKINKNSLNADPLPLCYDFIIYY